MGLLTLVEDRPTPRAVYNWHVYTAAGVASFASCMIGYDSTFIGTTLALPSFVEEFGFNDMSASQLALVKANIVSVYQAGAFFGSLFAYASSCFWGRRASLFIFVSVFMIGGLVGFWINYGIAETLAPSRSQWLIPFAVQLIPGGMLLIGAFWLKESPRWLFMKGRREQALQPLCWIRNLPADDMYMIEEVAYIEAEIEKFRHEVGAGFWKPFAALKEPRIQWRFLLGGLLFLFQNGSGINAINYYSPTVFQSIGVQGTNTGFLTTGIFGVVKTVVTFFWLLFLIDHLGRRRLLMIGAIGGSLCMWFIGGYIKIADVSSNTSSDGLSSGGIAAMFFFYLWTAFYTPSWNGVPWVINSEMFDQNTRSLGQASAAANNWFWNFIISRFTPQMFLAMDYGVYFFFASLMLLSAVFVFFLVPETKSVPLEHMDRLFATRPVRKANKIVIAHLQEQEEEFRHNAEDAGLGFGKISSRSIADV